MKNFSRFAKWFEQEFDVVLSVQLKQVSAEGLEEGQRCSADEVLDRAKTVDIYTECPNCKEEWAIRVPVDQLAKSFEKYIKWKKPVKSVFKFIDADDMEILLSRKCPNCQKTGLDVLKL